MDYNLSMKLIHLAKLRKQYKRKQSEIAKYLGVHLVTYNQYELGKSPIPSDKLIMLADLFETSTDYLLGRKKIVITRTYESIDGEFKEIPTLSDKINEKLKKGD